MKAKKNSNITQEKLMGMFDYDNKNGGLLKRCFSNGLFVGYKIAGCINGYRYIEIDGCSYLEHRLVWVYLKGCWPTDQLDHINGNKLDNRIANLREVDNSLNQKNTVIRSNNKTGVMGIHARSDNGRWSARINHEGNRYILGTFEDFFEACCARKSAEVKFGYHENHGRKS